MTEIPLYIIGMSANDTNKRLVKAKFVRTLRRLEKIYSKIEEARISIKQQRTGGKKKNYQVSALIITPRKRHVYKESGWDLSNICEVLEQRLLRNLTKHTNKRLRSSVRKIKSLI